MRTRSALHFLSIASVLSFSMPAAALEEIYVTDADAQDGVIYQLVQRPGTERLMLSLKYTRPSGRLHSLAFPGGGKAQCVNANRRDLFEVDGISEDVYFTNTTYIRDVAYDSRLRFYFSEASGSGADGVIYRFDPATKRKTRFVTVPLSEVDGAWAGDFAFDSEDRLFVSSGNQLPSSIYEHVNGHYVERYTHAECITGLAFSDSGTAYFTNNGDTLYSLDNFRERRTVYRNPGDIRLSDVAITFVARRGTGNISGRLVDGRELWPLTGIQLRGPAVFWRTVDDSDVSRSGRFEFTDLADGLYYVVPDIRADTARSFSPSHSTVGVSGGHTSNVEFRLR